VAVQTNADRHPVRQSDACVPGIHRLLLPDYRDERGSFSPAWIRDDLLGRGLDVEVAQINLATNPVRGTLRGLHFQTAPFTEVKIIQVLSGALFDVIVDLRPASPAFGRSMWVRLDAEHREALYLPKGVAHGYQTLEPDTMLLYTVSSAYAPQHQGGVLWSDPALAIPWPLTPAFISGRDRDLPLMQDVRELPESSLCQ
jgi:dTDP-4-dehydrorhamnose 3,5-epimerase